nr:MFS transporter [Kocuria atrinae]
MNHDNANTPSETLGTESRAPSEVRAERGRWIVLTAVSLGLLLATIDTSILYIAVPVLEDALGASTSESLWIINMYPLVMTGLLLGTGTLGDRYGHKRVFLIGIALFGLASLVAAFSPTPGILIFSRACSQLAQPSCSLQPSRSFASPSTTNANATSPSPSGRACPSVESPSDPS